MNQSDPAEGKEANLLLNSESNWLFLPHRKDHSRALNRYTFPFSRIKLVRSPTLTHLDCIGGVKQHCWCWTVCVDSAFTL